VSKLLLSLCFTLKGSVIFGKVIASALLVAVVVAPAVDLLCAGVTHKCPLGRVKLCRLNVSARRVTRFNCGRIVEGINMTPQ